MGNLFVGDVPLAESPMKDHPLTPMRDSNLMRLLAPQVTGKVGHVPWQAVSRGSADAVRNRLDELAAQGVAHVVPDAIRQEDLTAIAEAVTDFALVTGGSALGAGHAPACWRRAGWLNRRQAVSLSSPPQAADGWCCPARVRR
jgi:uncharacterized protein YgbK (DUF1537 family)